MDTIVQRAGSDVTGEVFGVSEGGGRSSPMSIVRFLSPGRAKREPAQVSRSTMEITVLRFAP
jgi:hypothetical protein